jgi:V8-like Glu-specific endopeptidase
MMSNSNNISDQPLTGEQISNLRSLKARGKPPSKVTLYTSTFRLPERAKASLVKVRGAAGTFKVQVSLPGKAIGHRAIFQNIPAQTPSKIGKSKKKSRLTVRDDGVRPLHLAVNFIPKKVDLKLNERAQPPIDFDYRREGEIVNRPTCIFVPDDRYIYQDTNFPWNTVGRVDTPLGSCTGCTIGRRLLLTSNHMIQWNADGTAGWVRFRPAYYNGSAPFGEAWATTTLSWMKTTPADGLSDLETALDYVVCVLDSNMGDIAGYPGYRTYNSSWNGGDYWQHMGYPADLSGGERPSFQGNAIISIVQTHSTSGQSGYVLGHFNDIIFGHSGGPVWGWWADEPWPRVVGVQSSQPFVCPTAPGDTSTDNHFGGGPALSNLISWARSNYP